MDKGRLCVPRLAISPEVRTAGLQVNRLDWPRMLQRLREVSTYYFTVIFSLGLKREPDTWENALYAF